MWHILTKFNVLPTDPRFYNLTEDQISFILASMVEDNKELQGLQSDVMDEDFNYEGELDLNVNEEALQEGLEAFNKDMPDDIREELAKRLAEAHEKANELANGIDNSQRVIEGKEAVAKNIEDAKRMAKVMEKTGISYDDYIIKESTGTLNFEEDDEDIDTI